MSLSRRADSYFISAGEHSGDLLGADLVLALRELMPKCSPFGVAGAAMVEARVETVARSEDLSVMGFSDVVSRLPALRMLETKLLSWVEQWRPRFAVLIDYPGFHLRLAEQLRLRGIPVYQYVAPKVWAWGEGRVAALRTDFEMILGILPFEEEFFRARQVPYTYVGSPLKDRIDKVIVRRASLGLPEHKPVIACLPGSRPGEIGRNLPTLFGIRSLVARAVPAAEFIVPIAPNLPMEMVAEILRSTCGATLVPHIRSDEGDLRIPSWDCSGLRFVRGMSLELMATADVAVVASGTATLECALLGTPMVVVYTVSEVSYQIAKRLVKLPYVSLVNLMAGRKIVQEYIQQFTLEDVSREVIALLTDPHRNRAMREAFEEMRDRLKGTAAQTAAGIIAAKMDSRAAVAGS